MIVSVCSKCNELLMRETWGSIWARLMLFIRPCNNCCVQFIHCLPCKYGMQGFNDPIMRSYFTYCMMCMFVLTPGMSCSILFLRILRIKKKYEIPIVLFPSPTCYPLECADTVTVCGPSADRVFFSWNLR